MLRQPTKIQQINNKDFSSYNIYRRLSNLTSIRVARLMPKPVYVDKKVLVEQKAAAKYSGYGHVIFYEKHEGDEFIKRHEMNHGLQHLAFPEANKPSLMGRCPRITDKTESQEFWRRLKHALFERKELYANALEFQGINALFKWIAPVYKNIGLATVFSLLSWLTHSLLPLAITGLELAAAIIKTLQTKFLGKAVQKYGVDGYLALNLLGCPDPFLAMHTLKKLEKKGLLTKEGFTRKGRLWVRSFKNKIEQFLTQAEQNREQVIKNNISEKP